MRGLILAGDYGTEFYPATRSTNKYLLPLFDKPLIYYPLSTLLEAGCREIMVLCKAIDLPHFRRLLGDGSHLGCWLSYKVEPARTSLPHALRLAHEFIKDHAVAVVKGDSVFLGEPPSQWLARARHRRSGATIFSLPKLGAKGPLLTLDGNGKPLALSAPSARREQLPRGFETRVVTALYLFHSDIREAALAASTEADPLKQEVQLLAYYRSQKQLFHAALGNGVAWLVPESAEDFLEAGRRVRFLSEQDERPAGYVEAAAYHAGFIDADKLRALARRAGDTPYATYLQGVLEKTPQAA